MSCRKTERIGKYKYQNEKNKWHNFKTPPSSQVFQDRSTRDPFILLAMQFNPRDYISPDSSWTLQFPRSKALSGHVLRIYVHKRSLIFLTIEFSPVIQFKRSRPFLDIQSKSLYLFWKNSDPNLLRAHSTVL